MVAKWKRRKYSRKITLSQEYIYKHILLVLEMIAKKVKLDKKYLSNLLKKEVGISISEYIQVAKSY